MNPLLPALALAGCVALAAYGWALVRDQGPRDRFAVAGPSAATAQRPGVLGRLLAGLSDRLAPRAVGLLGTPRLDRYRQRLDAAGRPDGLTVDGLVGRKAAFTVLTGVIGVLYLLRGQPFVAIALVAFGWLWMDVWLRAVARRRQAAIDRDLPDFLDVLVVTVSAGMAFRPALGRVAAEMDGPIAEEIGRALHEMELGAARRKALEQLRDRNDSEALGEFVTALLQAEELGSPLAQTLTDMATDLRRSAYQRARREAARAGPRVSLIVTVVIVPASVLLIMTALVLGGGAGGLGGLFG